MVTRTKRQNATAKRRKVKVGALRLNKETIQDLSSSEQKQIKGGMRGDTRVWCESNGTVCYTCPDFCQRTP